MPNKIEEALQEFETKGSGRVRFLWNRIEARDWLRTTLAAVAEEAKKEGYVLGHHKNQRGCVECAKPECEHNWIVKDEGSGWLTHPGGREMKTVYCTKCLAERNI